MSKFSSEINLILRDLQNVDNSKQQILFDKTFYHLKFIALKYSYDKDNCEDILLESYMRIFKYINSVDFSKNGYNWMCKIVQNVAIDFNKDNRPSQITELSIANGIKDEEEAVVERNTLLNEISKLPEEDQKVLYMHFWEDLSYSQIAEQLNSKKSTVHKRAVCLIKRIKNILNK